MRTLALLVALLLLALQAQAQLLPEKNEEEPDKEQPGEEDQDMAISFADPETSGLQKACESPHHSTGAQGILKCHCKRLGCNMLLGERNHGSCFQNGGAYTFCCHRVK